MKKNASILVTGQDSLAGTAIIRCLQQRGYANVATDGSVGLDLTDRAAVIAGFRDIEPDYVFLTPSKSGSILANSRYPAEFFFDNMAAELNVIDTARQSGVKKLLFIGSSCMYPRDCAQPMKETSLMTGPLESTSEPYAIAKLAGITMCRAYRQQYGANFITVIPADAYGPGDDFDTETGHVLPALIARMHTAKTEGIPEVKLWGTGMPRRETLHADDLADACLFLMDRYDEADVINVGGGQDISIKELATAVRGVVGYTGAISFDTTKPDGMPRKLLDTSRMTTLGWTPKVALAEGLRQTYAWYMHNKATNN